MKKPFSLNLEDVPLIEVGDDKYVSGRRYIAEKSFTDSGWHQHNMGVLGSLESGIMGLRTEKESMVVSSGMIVYLPANTKHNEHGMGTEVTGWYICLPQERIEFMPKTICVLEQSDLLLALCNRVISWGEIKEKTQTQKRLVTTFLDELQTVEEAKYLSLPFPEHSGLHIVTKRLINEPEDMNSIDYWAKAAGLSRRSFTRHFGIAPFSTEHFKTAISMVARGSVEDGRHEESRSCGDFKGDSKEVQARGKKEDFEGGVWPGSELIADGQEVWYCPQRLVQLEASHGVWPS